MSLSGPARACALLALTAALTAGCGSDDPDAASSTTTTADPTVSSSSTTAASAPSTTATTVDGTRTIEIIYANGQVAGGVRTETVGLGEKVRLRVTSDVAEEVHVHTYDVVAEVAPGETVELELTAAIPGRHEVEMEKKGKQVMVLEVR